MDKKKTLDITHPELCKQWSPKNTLKPSDVSAGSNQIVRWEYSHYDPETGHHVFVWDAKIYDRVRAPGVPFLTNHRVWPKFNDLETKNPKIAALWHKEKNFPLKPSDVMPHARQKVWWCMNYHDDELNEDFFFEWESTIGHMVERGGKCPYLNGTLLKGFNDLETRCKELLKEWDYCKNTILPCEFTPGSNKKVWWKLPYTDPQTNKSFLFEWEATINSRTAGAKCPFLTGNKVLIGFNDIWSTHRECIEKEWDFEANTIKPTEITSGSCKVVHWHLWHLDIKTGRIFNFKWVASVRNRLIEGHGCPYLSNRKIMISFNDLATTHKELVDNEWDYEKNTIKPTEVTAWSEKEVWWKMNFENPRTGQIEEHSWKTTVACRANGSVAPLKNLSRGERTLYAMLKENHIKFEPEKTFDGCANKNKLRFDIYIPKQNIVIEYDGIQHFRNLQYGWGRNDFQDIVKRDGAKNEYLFSNGITLLRIPYTYDPIKDADKIEEIVLKFIKAKIIPQEIINFYAQFEFSNYAHLAIECQNSNNAKGVA